MLRILLFIVFLLPAAAYAQQYRDRGRVVQHNIVITVAGHQSRVYSVGELGIARAYSESNGRGGSFYQYGLGSECLWRNGDSLVLAPKISCEAAINMLGLRLNLLYYTDLHSGSSLKFRPEIGLTALGYVNIYYGYTLPITDPGFVRITHSISLQWNIFCGGRKFNGVR